jgi:integrase
MVYKRGGVYWFKFRFASQLFRESARTKSKTLARQAERKRHQQLEEALHGIRKRTPPVLFAVAADAWLALKKPTWAAKSFQIEARNVNCLRPAFGSMLLIDINAEDIARYQRARLKEGVSPKTINLEVGTLRAILRRHRLWSNLQPDVTMMSVQETAGKALTLEEEQRLLTACGTLRSRLLLPIVTLALHTGMRRGEIQALRWSQVDFLRRSITVGTTKTKAGSGRVIPLNERATACLLAWATNFPGREPEHAVFPREHYGFSGDECKPHAETVDPAKPTGDITSAWESAKRKAGVSCRFHDLRHSACTRLLERGASLAVAASIMGWSASTTAKMAKRYGHIGWDAQRAAVERLDSQPSGSQSGVDSRETTRPQSSS